jgi:hypothetical protein
MGERGKRMRKQSPDEIAAAEHLRKLQGGALFTIGEDGDKRSLGSRGVGVAWNIWRSVKVIVHAYLRDHAPDSNAGEETK